MRMVLLSHRSIGQVVPMKFSFTATGHPAILSLHPTTLEITKDPRVTGRGDCIVAANSTCGALDLPDYVKKVLSSDEGQGELTLTVRDLQFPVKGKGASGLTFKNERDIVIRRSGFVSDRTLMVYANKASLDIPRRMVRLLQDPSQVVTVEISV